jgi:excinuclease ABC subunit C
MLRKDLKKFDLPDSPGVYSFLGPRKKILYIGKAASIKSRVRSYFAPDIIETRGSQIQKMVSDARSVSWQETDSVLEALILEANLIKKHQPLANVKERDNRSFNYLVITHEDYPRVLIVRGRELFQKWNDKQIKHLFGPFPEGGALREAMKVVRKIFPFRDVCKPDSGKQCFNRQIGLCTGVCEGAIPKKVYLQTIRHITLLFSGKKKMLVTQLEKEMKKYVKVERFEEAQEVQRQIKSLIHIRDVALIRGDIFESRGGDVTPFRIEAYDIAHTAGTETVGVMVVIENGSTKKSDYRMFKVHSVKNDDTGALREVLNRRLEHLEWPSPRLIVIDGGKGHLNAAKKVLFNAGVDIPIVAVVKDECHRPREIIGATTHKSREKEILLANSEAHRFALAYHNKRRRRMLK